MPSDEAWEFAVTIPAGTPIAAPLVTPTVFPSRKVDLIRWRFPPGSLGVVGVQIGARSVQIIPRNPGQFLIASGEQAEWQLVNTPDSGDWSVIGYNTGVFPHTVYVTYMVSVIRHILPPVLFLDDDPVYASMGES